MFVLQVLFDKYMITVFRFFEIKKYIVALLLGALSGSQSESDSLEVMARKIMQLVGDMLCGFYVFVELVVYRAVH